MCAYQLNIWRDSRNHKEQSSICAYMTIHKVPCKEHKASSTDPDKNDESKFADMSDPTRYCTHDLVSKAARRDVGSTEDARRDVSYAENEAYGRSLVTRLPTQPSWRIDIPSTWRDRIWNNMRVVRRKLKHRTLSQDSCGKVQSPYVRRREAASRPGPGI